MYIVASFEHTLFVELALSEIEEAGVPQTHILALPLDKRNERPRLFDNMHDADGESLIELALPLGTIFMLLGAIYGFLLRLGPVLWALFGLVGGSIIGVLIKFVLIKRSAHEQLQINTDKKKKSTEVFIMILCADNESKQIEHILWNHHALGVGTLKRTGSA
jgi:hypothetical protein